MRVLLAVADTDESVRVASTTHELFGEGATYLVMHVGSTPMPLLGSDPMMWGVAYPLALGGPAGATPMVPTPLGTIDGPGTAISTELGTPQASDLARQRAEHVADSAHLTAAETIGEVGDPAERIRTVAEEEHADVIVVGASEQRWFRSLVHPSVSRAVLREADRPVLVIP